MWITKLLSQSKYRHLFSAIAIIAIVSAILIMDSIGDAAKDKVYKAEIERISKANDNLVQVVADIAGVPKYSIENRIDAGKSKDSHITLIPDNDLNVINPEPEVKTKRKRLFGWLKKKD